MNDILVVESEIDIQGIMDTFYDEECGAIVNFVGTTRSTFNGKRVLYLDYEAYRPMALSEMTKISNEARQKYKDLKKISIVHRIGKVNIKEASIIVITSGVHRKDSIEAIGWIMDQVKARVPIWKREYFEDGSVWKENQEWRDLHPHRCC